MVAQAYKTGTSKNKTNEKEKHNTIQHRTVLIISPLRLLPPDDHHSSDVVCWRRREGLSKQSYKEKRKTQ